MKTYLQLINTVLHGLREGDNLVDPSATVITDGYHLYIAHLINQFISEVENAAEWWALRQQATFEYAVGGWWAAITTVTDQNVRLFHQQHPETGEWLPMAFNVTNSKNKYRLAEITTRELMARRSSTSNQTGQTLACALDPWSTGTGFMIYPSAQEATTILAHLLIPQGELDPTAEADLNEPIRVPWQPVAAGAIWYALAERGEELGVNPEIARQRYEKILADAIAQEDSKTGSERYDIVVA